MADAAPVLMWTADAGGGCDWVNAPWLAFTGRALADEVGDGWADGVHPEDRARCRETSRAAMAAGRPFTVEYRLRRRDGVYRWVLDTAVPRLADDGTCVGFMGSCVDVTEAHEATARAERLQALTARLNEATSAEQVAEGIVTDGVAAAGADAGGLLLVHPSPDGRPAEFEAVRSAGYGAALVDRYRRFPVGTGGPASDAVRLRELVTVGSAAEWRARYPDAPEELSALGAGALAVVPVCAGERVLAALVFGFGAAGPPAEATRTLLTTLGEQCALALERQRLHAAELRGAARHSALLATIQDAFVAYDRELRFTYVNAQAERLLRRPAAALIGQRLPDVVPTTRGTPVFEAICRTLATGEGAAVEAFSAATQCWLHARMYPAPDGVAVVFQDVTARRRAQDGAGVLADASRLLAAAADDAAALRAVAEAAVPRLGDWCAVDVVVDDAGGAPAPPAAGARPPRVERVATVHRDPAALALGTELERRYPPDWSAWPLAEVLRDARPLLVPEVTDAVLAGAARDAEHLALLRALRLGSVLVVPLVARGATLGALTLCVGEMGRRYDADDQALAEDLARRAATAVDNARLYRAAERARAEAEAANRAKSAFLATMSHELRTPLNAVGGYAELLEMGIHGPVTPEQRQALGRIRRSQRHLLGLINEVLDYARLEAGRVQYAAEPVHVAAAVAGAEALVAPQVGAKGLALAVGACDPALAVRADPEKLGQVLLNLLSNAVKFTDPGGRVAVTWRRRVAGGPAVVDVAVADTGVGIPADQLPRVFEPFVQLGRALNRPAEGTGLGLAISRDLARGMGGDLTAESAPGRGSTFTLTLPAA